MPGFKLIQILLRSKIFLAVDIVLLILISIFAVSGAVVISAGWDVTCHTIRDE